MKKETAKKRGVNAWWCHVVYIFAIWERISNSVHRPIAPIQTSPSWVAFTYSNLWWLMIGSIEHASLGPWRPPGAKRATPLWTSDPEMEMWSTAYHRVAAKKHLFYVRYFQTGFSLIWKPLHSTRDSSSVTLPLPYDLSNRFFASEHWPRNSSLITHIATAWIPLPFVKISR